MGGPDQLCRARRDERTRGVDREFELRATASEGSVQVSRILSHPTNLEANADFDIFLCF